MDVRAKVPLAGCKSINLHAALLLLSQGSYDLLGTNGNTKTDVFSEKFQKGGGVISNPKIYIADFGLLNRAFWAWKWYKRVISGFRVCFFNNCIEKNQNKTHFEEGTSESPSFGAFLKNHQFWRRPPSLTEPHPTLEVIRWYLHIWWSCYGHATKSDEFLEKFQATFDPPPHFWKIKLHFFYDTYGCIYTGRYDCQIV